MKLCLGTVQFGLDYGVVNETGKIKERKVYSILRQAHKDIEELDTSTQYGNAEKVVGDTTHSIKKFFYVTTKTRSFENLSVQESLELINKDFEQSRKNLKNNQIRCLLFHNANDLLQEKGKYLFEKAYSFKKNLPKLKVGVSVYCPFELKKIQRKISN